MSVSCNTFPTLTSTGVFTTQSPSVTTTTSVTTSPPTLITTTTLVPCTAPTGVTSTCIPIPVTTVISQPGAVVTVQVPITVPVDITTTRFDTLFGTSCTTINKPVDPTDPTPPPFTPPPNTITSVSSSTQPNGIITVVTKTEISTQPPEQSTSVQRPNDDGNKTNLAPIIGGVVGGFFGLIAIVALIWFILKRRRRWDDIFDKDDDIIIPPVGSSHRNGRFSLDVDTEPKPYQYGLVGQAMAPVPASPPNSPPMLASIPTSTESAVSHHNRHRSSLTPLNLPMTASSPGLSATTISSRPSTGGSTQPLRPPSQQGSYFPAQPLQPQTRPADFGRPTSTAHSHNQSIASYTTPSVYSGGTHAIGLNMGVGSDDHSHFNRSGSPTSVQEQQVRILQVANAPELSPQSEIFPFTDSLISSSSSGAAASAMPQRDGKGRLRTSTGKAPLVHLDGGRVQQELQEGSSSGGARPSGAAPPAYEA